MLDTAPESTAAQQKCIDLQLIGFWSYNEHTDQAVVAESVGHLDGETFIAVGDERLNLGFSAANRRQVELVRPLGQVARRAAACPELSG